VASLNRDNPIRPKSERQFCEVIFERALRPLNLKENSMKKNMCVRICAIIGLFISISYWGCSNDGNPSLLRVRVVNSDGKKIAHSTVVLGNPDGSMVTFGTTDANGMIRFQNPPDNATVTAATDCQTQSYHYYSLAVTYDVNMSEVTLTLFDCSGGSGYGTLNVNITDGISGIDFREVTVGGLTYGRDSHTISLPVFPDFYQSDDKISVVTVGYGADDNPVGYVLLLDQTFYDGMTVDVTIHKTDFGYIEYIMQNVPQSVIRYVLSNPMTRKGADTYVFGVWDDPPVPSSVTIPYIPDFGESYRFIANLYLDSDGDGTSDSEIGIHKKSETESNQIFDFSKTPQIPANLTFSMTKPGCPTVSWSGSDVSSQFMNVSFSSYLSSPDQSYYAYSLTLPPSRTSIGFPELPETLAAFRPTGYENLDIYTYKYDIYSGYDDYLKKTDMYYSGTYKEPSELLFTFSKTGL
jgi:hypothetical protein